MGVWGVMQLIIAIDDECDALTFYEQHSRL
jgi:hypothetical protein